MTITTLTVTYGRTIQPAPYESKRVEVSATVGYDEETDTTIDEANNLLTKLKDIVETELGQAPQAPKAQKTVSTTKPKTEATPKATTKTKAAPKATTKTKAAPKATTKTKKKTANVAEISDDDLRKRVQVFIRSEFEAGRSSEAAAAVQKLVQEYSDDDAPPYKMDNIPAEKRQAFVDALSN